MPVEDQKICLSPSKKLIWLTCSLLTGLVFYSACGSSAKTQPQIVVPEKIIVPPEITATLALLDPESLTTLTRSNPFMSLLVPIVSKTDPVTVVPTEAPTPTPPPPKDPFASISLGGIIYRKGHPLAIMTVGSQKGKIVHPNDILSPDSNDSIRIKVAQILPKKLILQVLNPPADFPPDYKRKDFEIPSLVGFKSNSGRGPRNKNGDIGGTETGNADELQKALESIIKSQNNPFEGFGSNPTLP